jgi:predicted DNA-binding transcriptional regulator AlpA
MALYNQARRNAKKRGIDFLLSETEYKEMVVESCNTCAVSGILFDFSGTQQGAKRPWAPSIDRIDSNLPYTRRNCRLVCSAVNIAMNEWGETVLMRIARALTKNEYQDVANAVAEKVYSDVSLVLRKEIAGLSRHMQESMDAALDTKLERILKTQQVTPPAAQAAQEEDKLVGAADAKKLLGGVSDMTIWRWVRDGVLPDPQKIRNRNYWWKSQLIQAATQQPAVSA